MARPRLAVERPQCPEGHDGVVYLHGQRRRRDERFAKTRWRCVRIENGKTLRHYWTGARRTPTHPDGTTCDSCEHELARAEGPTVVPAFSFAVAEIARGLVLVGEGGSFRESSQKVRLRAGRFTIDRHGRRWASRQNALLADYLDNFAPSVIRAMTPAHWPQVLVLDSLPLGIRVRDAHIHGYVAGREGGAVLVAAGRDRHQKRTRNWLSTLAADETGESWFEFLAQLDLEPAPFWVVADGSKAIRNAVEAHWPKAIFYPCEEHLRERARYHATLDGAIGEPGVEKAIDRAFWGIEAWDELGDLIKGFGPTGLLAWWHRTDSEARRMIGLKNRYGDDFPFGNGPAESVALAIKSRIGERTRVFRNADRLATTIALMGLDLAEQANAAVYGRILRTELAKAEWDPALSWEGPHDYWGEVSSLDEMIMAGWERAKANAPGVMQDAVSASVERKAAAINVLNLAAGVAPLTPQRQVGSAVLSVPVAGKFLRDYAELMEQWDVERNTPLVAEKWNVARNGPVPAHHGDIPAGMGIRPYWICRTCGNEWRAWMTDRTSRLTGCRVCKRSWATEKTSIAAVHPELVAEWDRNANGKRTPERTKATSSVVVTWLCRDYPVRHDSYSMSPRARANWIVRGKPGCPECRSKLTKAALKAAERRRSHRGGSRRSHSPS